MKSKKNIFKMILCILVVLSILAISRNIIKNKKVVSETQVKNVSVTQAKLGSVSTTIDYPAKLEADKQVAVSPKAPGKVNVLNVKVGSSIKTGDTLFTIDSSALEVQLEQQQSGVDSANANLNKTKSSGVDQQVLPAQQAVKTSQLNYNNAKSSYENMKKLYSSGSISKQDLDSAKAKLDGASDSLSSAQQNLELIQKKAAPESIEVAQTQVSQAEAGVKAVKTQIDDNTIKSPISGVVSTLNIQAGEISPTGQPSLTIVDPSSIVAEIAIPDKMIFKIKTGQSLPVTVPSLPNKKFTGKVETISPDTDSKTQQYTVKVKIINSAGSLKPGMFSKISLPDEDKNNIITVPNEAIKVENGVPYVYTVKNSKIRKISIDTGISNDKVTQVISSKIHAGDNIVPEGQTFLNEGDKVKILN